jgi:MYXO-CTERM domain-containing protein
MRFRVGIGLASLLVATEARAQSFPPDATWTALAKGGTKQGDPAGDNSNDYRDAVGDTTNAAGFVWSDPSFLYLRMRINDNPTNGGGSFRGYGWGCAIDVNADNAYEYYAVLDGKTTTAKWYFNTVQIANATNDPADTLLGTFGSANVRALVTTTSFPPNPDWFVDWAIPYATIRGGGTPLAKGASVRFACGTSAGGTDVASDPISPVANASSHLSDMWSDFFACGDSGCLVDTDADGVPDVTEITFGTNPLAKDTDADGIADGVELTPTGGGAFAPVDTDGDGILDALDLDSDNDCVPDAVEGVPAWRDPKVPNANPSANCSGTTPVCETTTGRCVACSSDNASGGSSACPFASTPACQASGRCTQCRPDLSGLCSGTTPVCLATTGACVPCNGDNGSPASAACTTATAPACLAGGRCATCSPTNVSLCTPAAPACDPTGACTSCNGDHAGGTTEGCPTASAPRCDLAIGTCGTCKADGDCGTGHAGPTCDVPSGACIDQDSDGDGLLDSVEIALGTNPHNPDTDGDGIGDKIETTPIGGGPPSKVDTDGDGIIDALDLDSDDDTLSDAFEGTMDLANDGRGKWRDTDDERDMIPTLTELGDARMYAEKLRALGVKDIDDVDGDGKPNYYDRDSNGNGIDDGFEGRMLTENGIPAYLDPAYWKAQAPDAGPGLGAPGAPAAAAADAGDPSDQGAIAGSGIACSMGSARTPGVVVLALLALAGLARRRRR